MKLWELLQSLENRDRSGEVRIALEDHKCRGDFPGCDAFDITDRTHRDTALVLSLENFGIDNDVIGVAMDNHLDGADLKRLVALRDESAAFLSTLLPWLERASLGHPVTKRDCDALIKQAKLVQHLTGGAQ